MFVYQEKVHWDGLPVEKHSNEPERKNDVKYIELSSIRQIAFEVIMSLTKSYKKILD